VLFAASAANVKSFINLRPFVRFQDVLASYKLMKSLNPEIVVPGHGDHAGRSFVHSSLAAFQEIVALARRVHAGELDAEAAVSAAPYDATDAREPLERALAQLRGALD